MARNLFTSESVTEGHPDKICDQISDAVLDAILAQDAQARVACETITATGMVLCMGEITTTAKVDIPQIARDVVVDIGYDRAKYGFDGYTCSVLTALNKQSPDIAMGVNDAWESRESESHETGAGDQGMMFGYACDETPELMPLPISLAHKLAMKLTEMRKNKTLTYLRPDGKAQVTVEYEDDKPLRIDTVVVSTQHAPDVSTEVIRKDIMNYVINTVLPKELLDENTKYFINPTGRFVVGGPQGDSGLTGRKIIVDTYGGMARHGGGAFSGKDPTKVDRSAAYAVHCQEHRGCRSGKALRSAARLCHRRCQSGFRSGRHLRHQQGFGTRSGGGHSGDLPSDPCRHHRDAGSAQAAVPPAGCLRPHGTGRAGRCVGAP